MDLKFEGNVLTYASQSDASQFLTSKELETYSGKRSQVVIADAEWNLEVKKSSKFTRSQRSVLLSLIFLQIASFASKSVVAPFFPEKARIKGVSTTMSGFIYSAFSLFMFLSAPFMTNLTMKFGIKAIMLSGILLQGVGNLMLGLADFIDSTNAFIVVCLTSRIMEGIGATAFYTSRHTCAAQIFPDDVNFVVGILGIALGVGFCIGPASGGVLFNLGGYQFPFYVLGGILLCMIPLNYYLIPGGTDSNKIEALKSGSGRVKMWEILKMKAIIVIGLGLMVAASVWEFIMATISVELIEKFFLSPSQVSIFFVVITGTHGIFGLFWGYVADRAKRIWIIIAVGLFIACLSTLFLGPSPVLNLQSSLVIEYVAIVIWSNAVAMTFTVSFGATLKISVENGFTRDENSCAILSSYNALMFSFGGIVGPTLGSFLIQQFGFPLACTIMGSLCFIMGIIMTTYFAFIRKTLANIPNVNLKQEASETRPLL